LSLKITGAELERALRAAIDELDRPQAENLCTTLQMRFERCGTEPLRCVCSFPCAPWASNRIDRLHGGALAGMLDQGMGILCAAALGRVPPTVEMNIHYLRPAPIGPRLFVSAQADSTGRSFWHIHCTAFAEDEPDKPVATASGVYFSGEYRK